MKYCMLVSFEGDEKMAENIPKMVKYYIPGVQTGAVFDKATASGGRTIQEPHKYD